MENRNVRLRLLSNVVILYLLLALAWWSVLLFSKNKEAFRARVAESKLLMIAEGLIQSDEEFLNTLFYKNLEAKYERQEWMIMGETFVFIISLIIGVWLINRGYNKVIDTAQQRRNFLLSITHELKSPIASIQLVLETFQRVQLDSSQISQLSDSALLETKRLNQLVSDLLLAAKMETTYTPNLEYFNLSSFLTEIINRIRNKYPNIQFELRKPDSDLNIKADKAGITSVVVNLLENAVKYSSNDPKISSVLRKNDDTIWIEVADNGIGIPEKEKSKIFERFYRVGNEDTRKTKGTGLGLYIVNQIVLAHKGIIKVSDNQPKGTIFTIALPK